LLSRLLCENYFNNNSTLKAETKTAKAY